MIEGILDIFRAAKPKFEFISPEERRRIVQRLSKGNINLQQGKYLSEKDQKRLVRDALTAKI